MEQTPLEAMTISPNRAANRCVIWLHGLGADGHDFENIVPELGLPSDHDVRFVFPHAPYRPITINQNMMMRGWYDIRSLDDLAQEDEAGIETACHGLEQLINQQDIPNHRIVLAGFSQGGAIALLHTIRHSKRFAGVIGLSTYLPFLLNPKKHPEINQQEVPILLCHGDFDNVIPASLAKATFHYLRTKNPLTELKTYPIAHQLCAPEVQYIGTWLIQNLKLS